jgi:hypothetical protein
MIIVDDVVFNTEARLWFYERSLHAVDILNGSHDIPTFFRTYLPENAREGQHMKDTYEELTAGEMWCLFDNLFMLMSDILKDKPPLPKSISIERLKHGISVVEKVMVFWSLAMGVNTPSHSLAGLRKDFISADGDSTNMRFCIYVFCMMKAIWERVGVLERILCGRDVTKFQQRRQKHKTNTMVVTKYDNNEYGDGGDRDKFMREIIIHCCSGDLDDFIISVKENIANKSIGFYHIELAKIKGYELLGMREFGDMPKTEAWRRLFTSYFDREETNFDMFYQTYMYECINFMLLSFLSLSGCGGISYLPVYKLFSDNDFRETHETSISRMINTKQIRSAIYKLYKIKC